MIGKSAGWSSDLDYRTLASVVHTVINQGRKLKNSSAQRKKCVKAVLGQANRDQIGFIESDQMHELFVEIIKESNFNVDSVYWPGSCDPYETAIEYRKCFWSRNKYKIKFIIEW